jgi:hypothetical protein
MSCTITYIVPDNVTILEGDSRVRTRKQYQRDGLPDMTSTAGFTSTFKLLPQPHLRRATNRKLAITTTPNPTVVTHPVPASRSSIFLPKACSHRRRHLSEQCQPHRSSMRPCRHSTRLNGSSRTLHLPHWSPGH